MATRRPIQTGPAPQTKTRLDAMGRAVSPTLLEPGSGIARPLPTPAELSRLELNELNQVLRAYRITAPWNEYVDDTKQYLRRMSMLNPRTNAYRNELDRYLDTTSKKAARQMAKKAQRTASWLYAAGDNIARQKFIWINEDDEHLCDVCDDAAGLEGTLAEIADSDFGMPGQSCLGGNDCRCELMPINY